MINTGLLTKKDEFWESATNSQLLKGVENREQLWEGRGERQY